MSGYLDLEGKRALVTGGTKGVGQRWSPRYTMPVRSF